MAATDPTALSSLSAHVAFRAPPFCNQDPAMGFAIIECNFKAASIKANLTKVTHATALLPPDVLFKVSDVISNAAASTTPYDDLKAAVLSRLQSTVTPRLQELLSKEELGVEKLSDLLRRMKKLLGDKYSASDTDLFRHL